MVEKISSLIKDFIIYVIPGSLVCYSILQISGASVSVMNEVGSKTNIAILSLFFSFIIGFIVSQLQIIGFWWAFSKKKNQLLEDAMVDRDKVISEACKILGVDNIQASEGRELNSKLATICYFYVKIRGSVEANSVLERDGYLSSFSTSIFLPIILSCFAFLKGNNWRLIDNLIVTSIVAISLFFLIKKIAINFRKGRFDGIFKQFLMFAANPELRPQDGE